MLQQRMFPGCDPFRTEEERPTMFFIQVPFPSRRHWVGECLPRNVNQPRFGLRVDAEIACVTKDHAPRQHRMVDAEGGWDGGVSRFAQAKGDELVCGIFTGFSIFIGKVFMSTPEDTGPAYTQMKLQHRSRAPGPPYNSRTRSATGPGREALIPARSP